MKDISPRAHPSASSSLFHLDISVRNADEVLRNSDNPGRNQSLALPTPKNIVFLSSCPETWGGSEELWGGAARNLAGAGHKITAIKMSVDLSHARAKAVLGDQVALRNYWDVRIPPLTRYVNRLLPIRWQFLPYDIWAHQLRASLRELHPDLVVISQGDNFDGLSFVNICHDLQLPYVLISQKASDHTWPADHIRPAMRRAYQEAERAYFVSRHNQELTEEQMGVRLINAEVVRNPCQASLATPLSWPEELSGRVRLACIGRAYVHDKGQDVLLRVLAQRKWKARLLEVTFYGKGIHTEGLKEMADLLGLTSVHFAGFTHDISAVWKTHHGLILPSRAEGLPLVLVEAMLYGRPAIVSQAGGVDEVLNDNETGFLADGTSISALDEAMERAWQCREKWEEIGQQAARHIRQIVPSDPCAAFAEKLMALPCLC